jgi:hypothetical protein
MRNSFQLVTSASLGVAFALAAAGCTKGVGGGNGAPDADVNGTPVFEIRSVDITLNPGQEVTYCYYFHTPNTTPVVVNKWVSDMTAGSHHMIMFFNNGSQPADGTFDTSGCGLGGNPSNLPIWVYASATPHEELDLPADDGAGKPLAMNIPANQGAYFQMHYLNPGDQPLTVNVDVKAYGLAAGVAYTQTSALITYNTGISIPMHAVNHPESASCSIPSTMKFWQLTTHSHKQTISAAVKDGSTTVVSNANWEHPTGMLWTASPFYTFGSGALTYECIYNNIGQTAPPDNENRVITSGPSAQTDEMCMATAYFFPATGPKFCINSLGPF